MLTNYIHKNLEYIKSYWPVNEPEKLSSTDKNMKRNSTALQELLGAIDALQSWRFAFVFNFLQVQSWRSQVSRLSRL